MRRRDLILGLAAALAPRNAPGAGQPMLIAGLSPDPTEFVPQYLGRPLRDVPRVQSWEEGRDYRLAFRSTAGANNGLSAAAAELAAQKPDVFLAFGDEAIRAAQAATGTIPIAAIADDMVASRLVATMPRPGGNTTGISILAGELDGKRIDLLHELLPGAGKIGALADPTTVSTRAGVEDASRRLGRDLVFADADSETAAVTAIRAMAAAGIAGLSVCASPILYAARFELFRVVNTLRLPTVYQAPDVAGEGGLLAYGAPFSGVLPPAGLPRCQDPERRKAGGPARRAANPA